MLYCMYYGCVSIQGKLGEIRIVEIFENETSEWTDGERADARNEEDGEQAGIPGGIYVETSARQIGRTTRGTSPTTKSGTSHRIIPIPISNSRNRRNRQCTQISLLFRGPLSLPFSFPLSPNITTINPATFYINIPIPTSNLHLSPTRTNPIFIAISISIKSIPIFSTRTT